MFRLINVGKAEDLDYVLANLEQLVVKEAQGSGGYGMLIGPQASNSQIESFRDKIHCGAAFVYCAADTGFIGLPDFDRFWCGRASYRFAAFCAQFTLSNRNCYRVA